MSIFLHFDKAPQKLDVNMRPTCVYTQFSCASKL